MADAVTALGALLQRLQVLSVKADPAEAAIVTTWINTNFDLLKPQLMSYLDAYIKSDVSAPTLITPVRVNFNTSYQPLILQLYNGNSVAQLKEAVERGTALPRSFLVTPGVADEVKINSLPYIDGARTIAITLNTKAT